MPFTLKYFDEVLVDVGEAKAWHKMQMVGLEVEFAASIYNSIQKILLNPIHLCSPIQENSDSSY